MAILTTPAAEINSDRQARAREIGRQIAEGNARFALRAAIRNLDPPHRKPYSAQDEQDRLSGNLLTADEWKAIVADQKLALDHAAIVSGGRPPVQQEDPAPAPAAPAKPASKVLFDSAEVRNGNGTWTGSQLDAAAERFESWVEANRFDLPEQYRPTFELEKRYPLGRSVASPKAEFGGVSATAEEYAAAYKVGFTAQDRMDFLHGFTVRGSIYGPKPRSVELDIIDLGEYEAPGRFDRADYEAGNLMTEREYEEHALEMEAICREQHERFLAAMDSPCESTKYWIATTA